MKKDKNSTKHILKANSITETQKKTSIHGLEFN